MSSKRRIVLTGFGVITPCGNGWEPYWDAARSTAVLLAQLAPTAAAGTLPIVYKNSQIQVSRFFLPHLSYRV